MIVLALFFLSTAVGWSPVNGKCSIGVNFRGNWVMLDQMHRDMPGYSVTISESEIIVTEPDRQIVYFCVEEDGHYNFLMRSSDGCGYICLGVSIMADSIAQYVLSRLNGYSADRRLFTPAPPSVDGNMTIAARCNSVSNMHQYIRRSNPGCYFPVMLQRTWSYHGSGIKEMAFVAQSVMVTFSDEKQLRLTCERRFGLGTNEIKIALRASTMKPGKDGAMCFVFTRKNGYYDVQVANTGDSYQKMVKTIARAEPIYLHETCDLIGKSKETAAIIPKCPI